MNKNDKHEVELSENSLDGTLAPGSCNWWSANDLMVTSGSLSATNLSGSSAKVSYLSHSAPPLAQPRRIVEEVLGHLYAKPPLTDVTCPISGINGSPSGKLKGAPTLLQNSNKKSPAKVKSSSLSKTLSALGTKLPSSSRRNVIENSFTEGHKIHKKNSGSSDGHAEESKNAQFNSVFEGMNDHNERHHGEESSSSSSSSTVGDGSMSSGNSSSNTTESEEDEEQKAAEERRQRQIDELKKKRKELRKKVKQLKHASLESSRQGKDGMSSPSKNISSSGKSNSVVPTPAHSYATSLYSSGSNCSGPVMDGDLAMPAPLDLCVKKPEFVTSTPETQGFSSKLAVERRRSRKAKSTVLDGSASCKSEANLNQDMDFSSIEHFASPVKRIASDTESVSSNKPSQSHSSLDSRRGKKRPWPSVADGKHLDGKHGTSGSSSETESSLDSGSDSENSDDTEKSAAVSTASSAQNSAGLKRHNEEVADSTVKRKRVLPEEKEIRIPVEHGWRRQTTIRCFSKCGVRGEVCYFTPCGKKLRSYSEVVRYLQRNGITDIGRDNFSFSTKVNVGDFLEKVVGGGSEEYVLLSESEIMARIEEVRSHKGSLGVHSRRLVQPKTTEEAEKQKRWEELQIQRRLEQQAEEMKKQKEQQRQAKQQEKVEKLEQQRIEKEMRNQQLLEERERRRQHMMLVRALESRKKQEEREKKREEILIEKKIYREKRMEQRRIELQLIREMKKPVDDMQLKDTAPLPTLNRIPGLKISGKAFGDVLMVYEFLNNFGETLGFDMENLPTLSDLQLGLLNFNEKLEEDLLSVVHHLLVCAIDDPGVPHCPQAANVLNHHLREVDITNNNVSEALRLYMTAVNRNSEIWQWLNEKPYLALNATHKAAVMAYLCNDLLYSKTVIRQIENSMDTVSALKRDKWVIEGQLRRLRAIHQRRCHPSKLAREAEMAEKSGESANQHTPKKDDEEGANDSGNDSDETQETGHLSDAEDEEPDITNEELEKKIEKLQKQQHQFQTKLFRACGAVRTNSFGLDRFRRRYWVIPSLGGVFVESVESSEMLTEKDKLLIAGEDREEETEEMETEEKVEEKPTKKEVDKKEVDEAKMNGTIKVEQDAISADTVEAAKPSSSGTVQIKEEPLPVKLEVEPLLVDEVSGTKESKKSSDKIDRLEIGSDGNEIGSTTTEKPLKGDIPDVKKSPESKLDDQCSKKTTADGDVKVVSANSEKSKANVSSSLKNNPSLPKDVYPLNVPTIGKLASSAGQQADKNWLLHSPFFASILAGSLFFNGPMMHGREINGTYFDNLQSKANSSSDLPFGSFLNFPSDGTMTADQMLKSFVDGQARHKPWFSILPRIPCNEKSVASCDSEDSDKSAAICAVGDPPALDKPAKTQTLTTGSSSLAGGSVMKVGGSGDGGNQITAAALANLQIGLLNGIPPDILMHSFLAAHGLSQPYQQQQNVAPALAGCTPSSATSSCGESNLPLSDVEPLITNLAEHPKRLMLDRMQFKKPKPIPPEMRRGWWRITDIAQLKAILAACHHRGIREKQLQKHLQKHFNQASISCAQNQDDALDFEITDLDREISKLEGGAPESDRDDFWLPEVALRVDLAILDFVENLEEKVAGASMQMKEVPDLPHTSWRLPPRLSTDDNVKFQAACEFTKSNLVTVSEEILDEDEEQSNVEEFQNPVEVAKERLLRVEAAIERRYVRPPLGTSTELNLNTLTSSSPCGNEEPTNGMLKWRKAVIKCTSSAQLAMCINALEASIAWDKSIMRASCQFCHSGDNEEMLLLCDGCDKGYHTYCFKPKMETIPDGDWYCYECLNKATGDKVCVLCGKKGKMVSCETCPKTFHITCLEPPLSKIPKGKWYCCACGPKQPKRSKGKNVAKETTKEAKENSKSKERKDKSKSSAGNKDITPCRTIVAELQSHEDAWPFLLPVNTKQFPTYRKIIKKAMDLTTVQSKLEGYKTREDFAADVRLIFDNCETFNEDDSPVGIAGHNMRAFFEVRWAELCGT